MDTPESSYAQVQLFARKKEDGKFQQSAYVKYKLEDFIYPLDVMNSKYDNISTNKPSCNVLQRDCTFLLFINLLSIGNKMSWNKGDNRNLLLKLNSKLGDYVVVHTAPKTSLEKFPLSVVELQQMLNFEKTDSKKKFGAKKGQFLMVEDEHV